MAGIVEHTGTNNNSNSNSNNDREIGVDLAIPLERVYETRGTMLHEIQAYKLSLSDIGRAISLNPDRPENYYIRGDCHSKLGNYEMALSDFNIAEMKGFSDICSLYSSRGVMKRICNDSMGALNDFNLAIDTLNKSLNNINSRNGNVNVGLGMLQETVDIVHGGVSKINKEDAAILGIRLASLKALCYLDVGLYSTGHDVLINTTQLVSQLETSLLNGKTILYCLLKIETNNYYKKQKNERLMKLKLAEERLNNANANAGKCTLINPLIFR